MQKIKDLQLILQVVENYAQLNLPLANYAFLMDGPLSDKSILINFLYFALIFMSKGVRRNQRLQVVSIQVVDKSDPLDF